MRRSPHGRVGGVAVLPVIISLALVAASCSSARSTAQGAPSGSPAMSPAFSPGPLPSSFTSLESLYLDRRPGLGPVHVIDLASADFDNQLLAESLAGLVNRSQVRIFLLQGGADDPDRSAEQFWLDTFRREHLVTVTSEGSLAAALHQFRTSVRGYVEFDDAEGWTVNAATTLASLDNALIASPETAPLLASLGLHRIEDLRHRWASAPQCYAEMQRFYASRMASRDLALLSPTVSFLRDFLIQQGIFTMYAHPAGADWNAELPLLRSFPAGRPVFGYMATNPVDEFQSTYELSKEGKFLVPTDMDRNLSFQIAVGSARPATKASPPPGTGACARGAANAMAVITDGDNIWVDTYVLQRSGEWGSSARGRVPLGWSISPLLSFLSPGVWDYYMASRSPADEFVSMMGIGYGFPSQMPGNGATDFYAKTFSLMGYLGLTSYWSLDTQLLQPAPAGGLDPSWGALDAAATPRLPADVLVSYLAINPALGQFTSPSGIAAWSPDAFDDYSDTAVQVAGLAGSFRPDPAARQPQVTFVSVPIWNFSVTDLIGNLEPLTASGVHFVTPSQAARCVAATANG